MKKFFLIILSLLLINTTVYAKNIQKNIDSIIKESNISKNSIAISIKNLDNGKAVYELNEQILMHPASVQKMMTIVPIMEVLGSNYNFTTKLYSRGKTEYVIQLSADPYLSTTDLKTIINGINPETAKKIYIDDSIIEEKDWGEGWQWDDDLNINLLRFNAYNLDGNIIKFILRPTVKSQPAQIIKNGKSDIVFINNVITSDNNNLKISRSNIAPNIIVLNGTIKSTLTEIIPNNNLKNYFNIQLTNLLENRKIYLKEAYGSSSVQTDDKIIVTVEHSVNQVVDDILLNSNNMAIETLGKIAGGKYYNKQGTDIDVINLFSDYCDKINLNNNRIRIVDSSGVSKNNLVSADFITEFLIKNKDNETLRRMSTPGTGTLSNRLIPLKDNLRAKTGTLSDISGISGFITSKTGKEYAFSIMINDPSSTSSEKKVLEDYLIRNIYFNF